MEVYSVNSSDLFSHHASRTCIDRYFVFSSNLFHSLSFNSTTVFYSDGHAIDKSRFILVENIHDSETSR